MSLRQALVASSVCGLIVGATLMLTQCKSERVHTAILKIDGEDGGALRGFDCLDRNDAGSDEGTALSCIFKECLSRCPPRRGDAGEDCFSECAREPALLTTCLTAPSSIPLMARARTGQVCVVVDLLQVAADVECRSSLHLAEWCAEAAHASCPSIARRVFPVAVPSARSAPFDGPDAGATAQAVDATYAAIRDALKSQSLVTSDAPDSWVVVRMAAFATTSTTCDDVRDPGRELPPSAVVGCALSCPLLLASRPSVPLELDFGVLSTAPCYETAVDACVALGTGRLPAALAALDPSADKDAGLSASP